MYELAAEFGCNRATVAERLKRAGISMRLQSPSRGVIEEMVRLYESGLSLQKVANRLGFRPGTVNKCLKERYVSTRDTHGRARD